MSETKQYKINEIFYSLQGEGMYTGSAAVFIRFAGCNLKCPFCDTQHHSYTLYTKENIVDAVNNYKCNIIVLTGGEPSLQIDGELICALRTTGKRIHIETNGTRPLPHGIDWVTCSPKKENDVVLQHIDELKVVYTGQPLEQYNKYECANRFLQPCSNKNVAETVEMVKNNPSWRLSLQTHVIIGIK